MHVLLAHNDYGSFSGEEAAVENVAVALLAHGHRVSWLRKSSAAIGSSALKRADAFFSGIYSVTARREMARLLDAGDIDVVQVQNLYPFLSASILPVCRARGVPVVMRCPNYRLFCPSGLHLRDGRVCEDCLGRAREWNCAAHNCERDRLKSIGYAVRNAYGRLTGMIRDNVTVFVVLSEFQKQRFVAAGIPAEQIEILPNTARIPPADASAGAGRYVSFVGRVSEEKGVRELLEAAGRLPDIPFRIAGGADAMPGIEAAAPANIELTGFLSGADLDAFYADTRMLVSPSKWFEGFPNTIATAMAYAKPVVGTRIGAVPEIVDEGTTGLLAAPGDSADLADKIRYLWDRPDVCCEMGQAGREKARTAYSQERFYERLMEIYAKAIELAGRR